MQEPSVEFDYSYDSIKLELDRLGLKDVKLYFFNETDSTNTQMKRAYLSGELAMSAAVYVAKRQTAGRGRLGRSFVSFDNSGVYLSLLLPTESDVATLTAYVAVMLSEVLSELSGISPDIKWVNDLYLGGRKIAGILCEGIVNTEGELEAAVIGVGVNVLRTDFPKEISEIAGTIEDFCGKKISRTAIVSHFIKRVMENLSLLGSRELIARYRSRLNVLNKRVKVMRGSESFYANAIDVNERAELVVQRDDGEILVLSSGEISIKL